MLEVTVAGRTVVTWLVPGLRSPLDADTVAGGRDIGTTGVFDPTTGGRHLHFAPDGEGFRDAETDSVWSALGRAVSGPMAGAQLQVVPHVDTFWFAWAAFLPRTRVVTG